MNNHHIKNIKTETGNKILDDLKKSGWKVISQYSQLMFDKGIDYDFYTLQHDDLSLEFEWDNWFEWCINGSLTTLEKLKSQYKLPEIKMNNKNDKTL